MGEITENMKFQRSKAKEDEALMGVIYYLANVETQKETAREVMAKVLEQLNDACILAPGKEDTPDHLMLKHTSDFFRKYIDHFKSNEPLSVEIVGNTINDFTANMQKLGEVAKNEEYADDITKRIEFFIKSFNDYIAQLQEASAEAWRKAIPCGVICGFLFSFLTFGFTNDFDYESFGWGPFIFIGLCFSLLAVLIFYKKFTS